MSEIPTGFVVSNDGLIQPSYKYRFPYDTEPIEENERIVELSKWLSENLVESPRKHVGSYTGKHLYERLTGRYVTNGEFILAMRKAGFKNMRIHKGSPNVDFFCWWSRDHKGWHVADGDGDGTS
jgi:hypothetical protein